MSFLLSVRSEFCAAHAIHNYPGKCEKLHGHNFAVEIAVSGPQPDESTGMVLDFALLKRALATVLSPLDHSVLNELPCFGQLSPSSENLARYIGCQLQQVLAPELMAARAKLERVTVSEKSSQSASWLPD